MRENIVNFVKAQHQTKAKMIPPTEKPEELVKALEALTNACKAVNSDFGENPLGEKPASVNKKQEQLYEVFKELYGAVKNITDYLTKIGHKADETKEQLDKMDAKVKDLESDKDALAQKWKIGSIIISSNAKAENSLVKAEKDIPKGELGAHAADLIKQKTGGGGDQGRRPLQDPLRPWRRSEDQVQRSQA